MTTQTPIIQARVSDRQYWNHGGERGMGGTCWAASPLRQASSVRQLGRPCVLDSCVLLTTRSTVGGGRITRQDQAEKGREGTRAGGGRGAGSLHLQVASWRSTRQGVSTDIKLVTCGLQASKVGRSVRDWVVREGREGEGVDEGGFTPITDGLTAVRSAR